MKASDFAIGNLNAWAMARLQERKTLRGLTVLPDDQGNFLNVLEKQLGALGIAAFVANADWKNESPSSSVITDDNTFHIVIAENVLLNRTPDELLAATVATDEERRALQLAVNQRVHQTGASQDFLIDDGWNYVLLGEDPTLADSWAPIFNVYQVSEMVQRVLHGSPIDGNNTCVWKSRRYGATVQGLDFPVIASALLEFSALVTYPPMRIA